MTNKVCLADKYKLPVFLWFEKYETQEADHTKLVYVTQYFPWDEYHPRLHLDCSYIARVLRVYSWSLFY